MGGWSRGGLGVVWRWSGVVWGFVWEWFGGRLVVVWGRLGVVWGWSECGLGWPGCGPGWPVLVRGSVIGMPGVCPVWVRDRPGVNPVVSPGSVRGQSTGAW